MFSPPVHNAGFSNKIVQDQANAEAFPAHWVALVECACDMPAVQAMGR